MAKPRRPLSIDIRSKRLPGKRMCVKADTTSAKVRDARKHIVRALIADHEDDIIAALRARQITIVELEAAYRRGQLDILRGRASTNGKHTALTLAAQVERLLETVRATKAEGTARQYEIVCAQLIERFGGPTIITAIRSDALQQWLHEPKQTVATKKHPEPRPWSHARQQLAAAIVGRLFNVAIAKEEEAADAEGRPARVRRNPVRNVELPGERSPRVEFLRPPEWRTLSGKVVDRPVHVLLALGILAGLRIGEAAHLRPGIDLVLEGRPQIRVQPREGAHPWRTKTRQSVRTVPIGAELLRIIRRHIELGYSGDRYLIISRPDRDWPMHRQVLERWTAAAFKLAGIRYGRHADALTNHSLRHSFISWLVQRGAPLPVISKLAGTSVKMILDVYGHLVVEDLENAVGLVDQAARE